MKALFRVYFTDSLGVCHASTLHDVAAAAGLDVGRSKELLWAMGAIAEIHATEDRTRRQEAQGVPFFVIDGGVALSGVSEVSIYSTHSPGELRAAFVMGREEGKP